MKDKGEGTYPMASRRASPVLSLTLEVEWFALAMELDFGGVSAGVKREA